MDIMTINILIQHDWINRKKSADEVAEIKRVARHRKLWAAYYKDCLKRGIPADWCKRF